MTRNFIGCDTSIDKIAYNQRCDGYDEFSNEMILLENVITSMEKESRVVCGKN